MATSLLWIGAEDLDFLPINGSFGNSQAGNWSSIYCSNSFHNIQCYRTGYARSAVCPDVTSYVRAPNFGNLTTLWISGRVSVDSNSMSGGPGADFLRILDPSGTIRLVLNNDYGQDSIGAPSLYTVTAAGVRTLIKTASGGFSPPKSTQGDRIDIECVYGASGTFNVWINGVQVLAFAGNLVTDSNAYVAQVDFGKFGVGGYHNNSVLCGWSECFVASSDTRGIVGIVTVPPAADGATQNWSGTFADIDTILYNDAVVVSTTAAATVGQFTTATAPPAGSFAVDSVWVSCRAQAGSTAPQHLDLGVHVAGADYFAAASALAPGMADYQVAFSDNPATAAPWTYASVAAGDVGITLQSAA